MYGRKHTFSMTIYDRYPSGNDELDVHMVLAGLARAYFAGVTYEVHGDVMSEDWVNGEEPA